LRRKIDDISASERRMRLKLKRIVVISEQDYVTLKKLGHAGDSFNYVTTKLLRIQKNHQEKQKQLQQQESGNNIAVTATADIFSRAFLNCLNATYRNWLIRLQKEELEQSNKQAGK